MQPSLHFLATTGALGPICGPAWFESHVPRDVVVVCMVEVTWCSARCTHNRTGMRHGACVSFRKREVGAHKHPRAPYDTSLPLATYHRRWVYAVWVERRTVYNHGPRGERGGACARYWTRGEAVRVHFVDHVAETVHTCRTQGARDGARLVRRVCASREDGETVCVHCTGGGRDSVGALREQRETMRMCCMGRHRVRCTCIIPDVRETVRVPYTRGARDGAQQVYTVSGYPRQWTPTIGQVPEVHTCCTRGVTDGACAP